jgi:hypothetical protein
VAQGQANKVWQARPARGASAVSPAPAGEDCARLPGGVTHCWCCALVGAGSPPRLLAGNGRPLRGRGSDGAGPSLPAEDAMTRLTDTQLVTLSRALQREDGAVTIPPTLNGAAAECFARTLVRRQLVRIVPATAGMPVWRRREDGEAEALVITDVACAALGVATPPEPPAASGGDDPPDQDPDDCRPVACGPRWPGKPCAGGKRDAVLALLRACEGATMAQIARVTGWQAHSIRAFLSGLRKAGQIVMRSQRDGITVYRVADRDAAATPVDCPPAPVTAGEGR